MSEVNQHGIQHAVVADQPGSVAELSPVIMARYRVPEGAVKIAGCSIDDVPFFEVSHVEGAQSESSGTSQQKNFVDARGLVLSAEMAESLGLTTARDIRQLPENVRPSAFDGILAAAKSHIADAFAPATVHIARVIWCKEALGKVSIHIGDAASQAGFRGWTRRLADGLDLPDPFVCELTGKSSYQVVADDQQRLTVPDALGKCSVSGRAIVESVLQASAISGAAALPEYFDSCCVTGDSVLKTELARCDFCQQQVSPAAIHGRHCKGCAKIPVATAALFETYRNQLPADCQPDTARIRETFARVYLSYKHGGARCIDVLNKENHETLLRKQKKGWFGKWLVATHEV